MALVGNIVWFVFVGWWNFLIYALLGGIFCITIIGIPIGKALFQYAKLMTFPYGKVIVKETFIKGEENVSAVRKVGGLIANILWLPIGAIMFLFSIAEIVVMACTIVGIPVAVVVAKSSTFLLWPVGAKVISKEQADTIRMEKSMMKVAGVAMAANAHMNQQQMQGMNQQPAQRSIQNTDSVQTPQQTSFWQSQAVENLKVEGAKALGNIRETSGKAAVVIAETTGKAANAFMETSSAGMANLKNMQQTKTEQMLGQKKDIKIEELLLQIEAKLYTNPVMAWVMSFLEYITLAIGVVSMIIGIILMANRNLYGVAGVIFGGIMYGIRISASILSLSALLGMIKRNHIFVIIVLAFQMFSHVVLGVMGMGFPVLTFLCCLGILMGYIMVFMANSEAQMPKMSYAENNTQATYFHHPMSMNGQTPSANAQSTQMYICKSCGKEYHEPADFCVRCGNRL